MSAVVEYLDKMRLLTVIICSARNLPSILHFSSEDQMTKWEICTMFGDIMGLSLDNMVPFKPKEPPQDGTVRPFDCHLDTGALQELGIDVGTMDFRTWWYVCALCHCSTHTDLL